MKVPERCTHVEIYSWDTPTPTIYFDVDSVDGECLMEIEPDKHEPICQKLAAVIGLMGKPKRQCFEFTAEEFEAITDGVEYEGRDVRNRG